MIVNTKWNQTENQLKNTDSCKMCQNSACAIQCGLEGEGTTLLTMPTQSSESVTNLYTKHMIFSKRKTTTYMGLILRLYRVMTVWKFDSLLLNHPACRISEEEVNHDSIYVCVQYYKNDALLIYNVCKVFYYQLVLH